MSADILHGFDQFQFDNYPNQDEERARINALLTIATMLSQLEGVMLLPMGKGGHA